MVSLGRFRLWFDKLTTLSKVEGRLSIVYRGVVVGGRLKSNDETDPMDSSDILNR